MIDGVLVIDATVHGFNFTAANLRTPFMPDVVRMLYHFAFDTLHPLGDTRYRLTFDEFQGAFLHQPALLEQTLFAESQVDVACYHGVPMYGFFGDGSSPLAIGERIADHLPHRMFLYADVSPTQPDANTWIDRLSTRRNVIGVKLYPVDMVEGRLVPVQLTDEVATLPLIERCRSQGIKVIAVHKAVPLGPISRELYHVRDLAPVIATFSDLQFEIVHGGFAFADETAALLAKYDNVWINLETTPSLAINHTDKFAAMIEPLLATGRHDRIFFASGATGVHPRPCVEAFWRLEMPRGAVKLTDEMKAGILGANFARMHGWDVDAMTRTCAADGYGLQKKLVEPWSVIRAARSTTEAVA